MSTDSAVIIEQSGTEDEGASLSVLGDRITESSWLSSGYRTNTSYTVTREDLDRGTPLGEGARNRICTVQHYYFESIQDGKLTDESNLATRQEFPVPVEALKHIFGNDCLQN